MGSNTALTHAKASVKQSLTEEQLEKLHNMMKQSLIEGKKQKKVKKTSKLTSKDFINSPRDPLNDSLKQDSKQFSNYHPHQNILYSQLYNDGDPFADNKICFPMLLKNNHDAARQKSISPLPYIPGYLASDYMPSPKALPQLKSCGRLVGVHSSRTEISTVQRSKTCPPTAAAVNNKSYIE
ncbi:predicted protein [Naegleria gruberi]|uniref:Predicted protein n=1 Tax=Naegleria gruberi TaxID=5762 RepID=D2UZ76_NAEGR|nr:uncharacterized protein NAEGRDRAFT_54702 [Naegleria gruberi]XP_002682640.1 uncharacterized protein NAEGRDRAFT_45409 [Naegleria gruberi]EFC35866.1 predicted protein [Naegleria gruberi]EFC49896.1 predicted protein [Naegleria gruberi]|eukprot:XP_002668610.1 predicted protein [Naegleria gruberi strain NEG-M]